MRLKQIYKIFILNTTLYKRKNLAIDKQDLILLGKGESNPSSLKVKVSCANRYTIPQF